MNDPLLYLGDHKRCSKCGKYKDMATGYYKKRAKKSNGIESQCKECHSKRKRKYHSREDRFWKFFWSRVIRVGECLEWSGAYGTSGVPVCEYNNKQVGVRRVVYRLAVGDLPENMFVLMICKNKKCLSQHHMRLGTRDDLRVLTENSAPAGINHHSYRRPERVARGDNSGARKHPEKVPRGERHPNAKLTDMIVRGIRKQDLEGESVRHIAQSLGVSPGTIYPILKGKTWKHVQ